MSTSVNILNETFKVKPITHVITLCVFSFGLYVVFRLYQLSKIANHKVKDSISNWFMGTAIIIHLLSFGSLVAFFLIDGSQNLLIASKMLHVISSLFHFIWIMKLRNRINDISGAKKGDEPWLRPFLSTFFHVIYMQHKINESKNRLLEPTPKVQVL
ncbi:hypothetical protein SOPP22_15125 [Shewanella sp. OPT22]|nr:hypothetical protein SOPP22_15125 [Shewanella sp. OPT22]